MGTAAEIVDPWLNGDPCEGCDECQRVCGKLQERIDFVLKSKNDEIERLREALKDINENMRQADRYFLKESTMAALKGVE